MAKQDKKGKLSREIINVFRTTQRNNIELTSIADNKANVLLSLNGLMIAVAIPLVLSNSSLVFSEIYILPLAILALTCFITMFICATVLRPSNFDKFMEKRPFNAPQSPFFFGNFYRMEAEEFYNYLKDALEKPEQVKEYLAQDLYYVGRRLGYKMKLMRWAFTIFIAGIFLTLFSLSVVLMWF